MGKDLKGKEKARVFTSAKMGNIVVDLRTDSATERRFTEISCKRLKMLWLDCNMRMT